MTASIMNYRFPLPRNSTLALHELLALQSLGLSAKGAAQSNGRIYLQPKPVKSGVLLSDLIADKCVYSGKPCIEGNEWALYFVILGDENTGLATYVRDGFRHRCLGSWFYHRFSGDVALPPNREDNFSSGGEALTEEEEQTAGSDGDQVRETSVVRTVASEPSFMQGARFLPMTLWATNWISPARSPLITLDTIAEHVYTSAAGHTEAHLSVTGHDLESLVQAFETVISNCILAGDFTQLLSPQRFFQITRNNGHMQTLGPGLERDVIYTAFSGYIRSFSKWFMPRFDNRASLQMSCGFWRASAGIISESRILAMKKLGAICALMLIYGMCPEPLNPLIFHYIIHNGDFNSLHRTLIQEWHPELLGLIYHWLSLGDNDSLEPFRAHFATYHDMDVSVLQDRNISARAPEILYYAIFGPEPPCHPEWKAFIQGFSLKCRNGFSFLDIPKAFEGGSEAFLSLVWTSIITGYDSVRDHIRILRPLSLFTHGLQAATDTTTTAQSLITKFLQGTGIPCPVRFAEVRDSFSPLVNLDKIDTPAFRPQMLLWAATGTPSIDPNLDSLSIAIVADGDQQYYTGGMNRHAMIAAGKVSFRTCLRAAYLPGSYILELAQAVYPSLSASGEPRTFTEAFEHWLLCEILAAIGGHSML